MTRDPNFMVETVVDSDWIVELLSPLPGDPVAGWRLRIAAGDHQRELLVYFGDWSERDIEAWLLKAANKVNHYRESDRGGPTPETLRHALVGGRVTAQPDLPGNPR